MTLPSQNVQYLHNSVTAFGGAENVLFSERFRFAGYCDVTDPGWHDPASPSLSPLDFTLCSISCTSEESCTKLEHIFKKVPNLQKRAVKWTRVTRFLKINCHEREGVGLKGSICAVSLSVVSSLKHLRDIYFQPHKIASSEKKGHNISPLSRKQSTKYKKVI